MRKAIYKAVAERLKTAKIGIQYISLWNRNTEQLTKQKAFRMPAVFVEFEPIDWSQLSQGARSADIRVRLHVITETLASPEEGGRYQDRALEHLDLLERVSAAMQGLCGDGFKGLEDLSHGLKELRLVGIPLGDRIVYGSDVRVFEHVFISSE